MPLDSMDFPSTINIIGKITNALPDIFKALADNTYVQVATMALGLGFGLWYVMWEIVKYYTATNSLFDMILVVFTLAMVFFLIKEYQFLVFLLHEFTIDIGAVIQLLLLGNDDPAYPLYYLLEIHDRVVFYMGDGNSSIWDRVQWFFNNINIVIASIIMFLINMALVVASAIGYLWSTWGFIMLGLTGIFMVPMMLNSYFAFLFDGWFRGFLQVLFFGTLARISTAVSCWGYMLLLDIPNISGFQDKVWVVGGDNMLLVFGMVVWGGLSVMGIRSSYQMSSALVAGMAGGLAFSGGIGGAVSSAAARVRSTT